MLRSLVAKKLITSATNFSFCATRGTAFACPTGITSSSTSSAIRLLSTQAPTKMGGGVAPADMPYLHHGKRPRHPSPKFKQPRKRASKLFAQINDEAVQESKARNPAVLDVPFRVGDAIEIEMVPSGGVNGKARERVRGVVLGRVNRGLASAVYIRDVVFGEPIDRKIPLHSPLLKKLTVLEENFVYKGRRKVKRAKLYFLRDRLPQETRVTKW